MFKVTWTFASGQKLVRLITAPCIATARERAEGENYQRGIFRRAGLFTRSTSAFEYLDRFPTPTAITVEKSNYPPRVAPCDDPRCACRTGELCSFAA